MTVRVVIPGQLRSYTDGLAEVTAEGATLAQLFADLDRQFPGIRFRVIDEQDRVRRHIVVFVGETRQDDLDAALPEGRAVQIIGALSGG